MTMKLDNLLKNRARYLLVGAAFVTFLYPISTTSIGGGFFYVFAFCAFFGLGVAAIVVHRVWALAAIAGSIWQMIIGTVYVFMDPTASSQPILGIVLFGGFVVFDLILIYALLEHVFVGVKRISNDVIYSAITAYILLGYVFAPLYNCVNILTIATTEAPAFVIAATPDVVLTWQQLVYYSFVTLTTMGYGDILPVTSWAQSLAAAEGVIGVLYIAILIGRLVGLNSASPEGNGRRDT